MRNARPLLLLLLVMIVLWSVAAWLWPTAVLYYFAIAGGIMALVALVHEANRTIENNRRP